MPTNTEIEAQVESLIDTIETNEDAAVARAAQLSVKVLDLQTTVSDLTTQVAALQAQLAADGGPQADFGPVFLKLGEINDKLAQIAPAS